MTYLSPSGLSVLDEVKSKCSGESRWYLESLCQRLPEEGDGCYSYPTESKCGKHEVTCGDDQCVHGLGVCDREFDCRNGGDEHQWYVSYEHMIAMRHPRSLSVLLVCIRVSS